MNSSNPPNKMMVRNLIKIIDKYIYCELVIRSVLNCERQNMSRTVAAPDPSNGSGSGKSPTANAVALYVLLSGRNCERAAEISSVQGKTLGPPPTSTVGPTFFVGSGTGVSGEASSPASKKFATDPKEPKLSVENECEESERGPRSWPCCGPGLTHLGGLMHRGGDIERGGDIDRGGVGLLLLMLPITPRMSSIDGGVSFGVDIVTFFGTLSCFRVGTPIGESPRSSIKMPESSSPSFASIIGGGRISVWF